MEEVVKLSDVLLKGNEVANSFRLGYEGGSNDLLVSFIDQLSRFTQHSIILKDPHFNNLIDVMLDAQQRDDNLFLADILQYELLPFLEEEMSDDDSTL